MQSINVNKTWVDSLRWVMKNGREVGPRNLKTKEMPLVTVVDMNSPVLRVPDRNLGYKFMAAEAAWILEGRNDLATIKPYSKQIQNYSDDGIYFKGAYGPKIQDQLGWAVHKLRIDPKTRQCVINIWRERPDLDKDIPCTLALQFYFRGTDLEMHAFMRSSDLWLGWPYDVFNFSQIATRILLHLIWFEPTWIKMGLGNLVIHSGSSHIYELNFDRVKEILEKDTMKELTMYKPKPTNNYWKTRNESGLDDHIEWLWKKAKSGGLR